MICLGLVAGTTGLEPATSAVTGQRSNQLSYVPPDVHLTLFAGRKDTLRSASGTSEGCFARDQYPSLKSASDLTFPCNARPVYQIIGFVHVTGRIVDGRMGVK